MNQRTNKSFKINIVIGTRNIPTASFFVRDTFLNYKFANIL
jgi:hypothetical protein